MLTGVRLLAGGAFEESGAPSDIRFVPDDGESDVFPLGLLGPLFSSGGAMLGSFERIVWLLASLDFDSAMHASMIVRSCSRCFAKVLATRPPISFKDGRGDRVSR